VSKPSSGSRSLKRHGNIFRLRALNALQMAVALDVRRCESLDAVVAADDVVCQVGAVEGLPITNRESPSWVPGRAAAVSGSDVLLLPLWVFAKYAGGELRE